ncbi:MAG: hypothetical protein AB4426_11925 [Xenococcaceae cyanobacterium]
MASSWIQSIQKLLTAKRVSDRYLSESDRPLVLDTYKEEFVKKI